MINQAIRILRVILGNTTSVTREQIENSVNQVLQMPNFKDLNKEVLIREVESNYNVRVESFRIIEGTERRNHWLDAKKSGYSWGFWKRYQMYLQDDKNFPADTLNELDRLTERVINGLFDPNENIQIGKRGLVVGQVQSGKTSNYTGLVCKAADVGYKIIIVLTGIHENLRCQTQLRIDEGFLGRDTRNSRAFNTSVLKIGVGNFGSKNCVAHSITSSEHRADFNEKIFKGSGISFDTQDPIIIVTKKHSRILKNLLKWLNLHASPSGVIENKSLLLIDDEADNASINTNNKEKDPTAINGRIRAILNSFRKSAYVGYTATPFANIFIPPNELDNLFPRDFIVNIPPPSNYIGPEKVFGFSFQDDENSKAILPIINRINDFENFVPDKHKKDSQLPSSLPESLKTAIRCFIITCAIRRLRGQINVHNSMLVHVTRFQKWQDHITDLIQKQFNFYKNSIDQNDQLIIHSFKDTFTKDTINYKSYKTVTEYILKSDLRSIDPKLKSHIWEDVLFHLNDAVQVIKVRAIHGESGEALDYYDHKIGGLSVIAVGGNKLSRGLTLEGLSISYYLRASKMYDTLMQMGRWFGYRNGYVDLCRLFTTQELNRWYCHITYATEELKNEFDYMSDIAGSTPEQYALKVRTHPGSEIYISASNKLRSTVNVEFSLSGRLVESYEINKEEKSIKNNLLATENLISALSNSFKKINENFLWKKVCPYTVISFFENISTPENLQSYQPENLIRFIRMQLANNELTDWSVALMSKSNTPEALNYTFRNNNFPLNVGCFLRMQDSEKSDKSLYYIRKSHIISPRDECIDLSIDDYVLAKELTDEMRLRQKKEGKAKYPNGDIVRNRIRDPKKPLLLIYLLDPAGADMSKTSKPLMGYAVSFPGSIHNSFVTYKMSDQMVERFNTLELDEEYEYDKD